MVAMVVALLAVSGLLPSYYGGLLLLALVYGVFAMSLDLLVGYTGLPSLGHAAYFGVAPYVTAILSTSLAVPIVLAIPAGIVAAVAVAALFCAPALRTKGAYYLMITLALSQVLWNLAESWSDVTGGENGIAAVPTPKFEWLSMGHRLPGYSVVVIVVFALCGGAMSVLVRSPFGYVLKGIRENGERMGALGYDIWRYKFTVSLIAALFAAIAGELYLGMNSFISPSALGVSLSAQGLLMVLAGAPGTLFGPVFGAFLVVALENIVSSYTDRWMFLIGLIYAAIALYAPAGAYDWVRRTLRSGARA